MIPKTLDDAYWMLMQLVSNGVEFPDACSKAATEYRVNYDALRREYDERAEDREYNAGEETNQAERDVVSPLGAHLKG